MKCKYHINDDKWISGEFYTMHGNRQLVFQKKTKTGFDTIIMVNYEMNVCRNDEITFTGYVESKSDATKSDPNQLYYLESVYVSFK